MFCASHAPSIVNDREVVVHIEHGEGEFLSIKGVDMAKFISGGVLTFNILQAFIEFLKHDEGMGTKKRIFMLPQDYIRLFCLFCTLNIFKFIMISTTK